MAHPASAIMTVVGSVTAFFGGVFSAMTPPGDASSVALIVALGGLLTALGGLLLPMARLWFESRREDRQAKIDRHDLLDRVNSQQLELAFFRKSLESAEATILIQRQTMDENRRLIEALVLSRAVPILEKPEEQSQ